MAAKPLPDQALLLKLLRYEPETGKLFWRERPKEMFLGSTGFNSWNKRWAGREAFTRDPLGYLKVRILGVQFLAHRIAWKMVTGIDPDLIDHINGERSDNRFANLRSVDHTDNARNIAHTSTRTPHLGVRWISAQKVWGARIIVDRKPILLGEFPTVEEAIRARKATERKYGFHPNHGRRPISKPASGRRSDNVERDKAILSDRVAGMTYATIAEKHNIDLSCARRIYLKMAKAES